MLFTFIQKRKLKSGKHVGTYLANHLFTITCQIYWQVRKIKTSILTYDIEATKVKVSNNILLIIFQVYNILIIINTKSKLLSIKMMTIANPRFETSKQGTKERAVKRDSWLGF
jgi:hypothetical protein